MLSVSLALPLLPGTGGVAQAEGHVRTIASWHEDEKYIDPGSPDYQPMISKEWGQRFKTGACVGGDGWQLSMVGIKFQEPSTQGDKEDRLVLTLHDKAGFEPGNRLATLRQQQSRIVKKWHPESGRYLTYATYVPTSPVTLQPDTKYGLKLVDPNVSGDAGDSSTDAYVSTAAVSLTASDDEARTRSNEAHWMGENKWKIDDTSFYRLRGSTGNGAWLESEDTIRIFIGAKAKTSCGYVNEAPPAPVNTGIVVKEVPYDWPLKPAGLGVGDRFRLHFITKTTRDATSKNIADYNTFVQSACVSGGVQAIQPYCSDFRAVGSTQKLASGTSAMDNTYTNWTRAKRGLPIYWMNSQALSADPILGDVTPHVAFGIHGRVQNPALVAPNYQYYYLWFLNLNNATYSDGTSEDLTSKDLLVWTGTAVRGVGGTHPLGNDLEPADRGYGVHVGNPRDWFGFVSASPHHETRAENPNDLRPFYGISPIFKVTGEETTDLTVSVSDAVATEHPTGDSRARFFVKLNRAASEPVTVDYATEDGADGTARAGSDYAALTGTITFAPGDREWRVSVPVLPDDVSEGLYAGIETFALRLSNATGAVLERSLAVGAIHDMATVSVDDASTRMAVAGGAKEMRFTVTLQGTVWHDVEVEYATEDGTATAGSDYTARTGRLVFPRGPEEERTATVKVTIPDHTVDAGGEAFKLKLTKVSGASVANDEATGLILPAGAPEKPTLYPTPGRATEGEGPMEFIVYLDPYADSTVTVEYETETTGDDTAAAGTDYTATSGTLTFAQGERVKRIEVPITDDNVSDDDETFTLKFKNVSSNALLASTEVQGHIDNDEPPEVSIAAASAYGQEGADAVFTVSRSGNVLPAFTVGVSIAEDGAMLGASPPKRVSFPEGVREVELRVPTEDDSAHEADATVTATLEAGQAYTLSQDASAASVTVLDDDAAPPAAPPGDIVWSADMEVAEYAAGNVGATSADLFSNVGGTAGLEVKWLWYEALGRKLHLAFKSGVDDWEAMTLQVGSVALPMTEASGDGYSFGWNDVDAEWKAGETVPVYLMKPAENALSTDATLSALTVEGAVLDPEFEAGVLVYRAEADAATVTVTAETTDSGAAVAFGPNADADTELAGHQVAVGSAETLVVATVTAADGVTTRDYRMVVAPGEGLVRVAFGAPSYTATEGGAAEVTVSLSRDPGKAVTVPLTATPGGGAETGDFEVVAEVAFQAGGDLVKTVTVSAVADEADEDGETVVLGFGTLPDGMVAGDTSSTTVALVDAAANSAPTGLPVISGTPRVGETLTASKDGIEDADGLEGVEFAWQWLSDDGSAEDGSSETEIAGATEASYTLTAAEAGKTVRVRVTFTDEGETEETLTSEATAAVNTPATGVPVIDGTVEVGETLTASKEGIADADGLEGVEFVWQWLSDDGSAEDGSSEAEIAGATEASYTLTAAEVGKTLRVRMTFTDEAGGEETILSEATAAVPEDTRPVAATLSVGDTAPDSEKFQVRVSFAEAVSGLAVDELSALEVGGETAAVSDLAEAEAGRAWTAAVATDGAGRYVVRVAAEAAEAGARRSTAAVLAVDVDAEGNAVAVSGPAVTEVTLAAESDGSWSDGDAVRVTLAFTEPVTVETASGTPTIGLGLGGNARQASYVEGSETASLVFTYSATSDDGTVSAVSVAADSLALNGGTIRDAADRDADLKHPGIGNAVEPPETVAPAEPLTGFTLVDASSGSEVGALADGGEVTLDDPANGSFGVLVATAADAVVGSVRLELAGAKTASRTLNAAPWSLYGNENGAVLGGGLPAGAYTLTATAYGESDAGGDALQTLSVSFTVVAAETPAVESDALTALFQDVPAEHGGPDSGTFTFRVFFNKEPDVSYKVLRDQSFAVTGGAVRKAKRVDGRNDLREIHVAPAGWDDVAVTLAGGRACGTTGAICTAGGEVLSNTLSATIKGPVAIDVADARVREAADAVLEFEVSLSRTAGGPVSVDYATADGTAKAGEDFTGASGTLSFAAGETVKTVSVAVLDDAHDEGEETMKPHSRLSRSSASWNPSGATPWARMRNASLTASVASSRSHTSRVSNSPRSGVAPKSCALSQMAAVADCPPVSMVSISKVMSIS